MTQAAASSALAPADARALGEAIRTLEGSNLAARLADYAGEPFTRAMNMAPKAVKRRIDRSVEQAVIQALEIAIDTLDDAPLSRPAIGRSNAIAAVTGAVGGMFGLWSLPIELPFTTTIMLRAIADIARHEGEDLNRVEARLACLEVFALSANGGKNRTDLGYFAARAMLSKLTADAAAYVMERGVTSLATPAINSLIAAVVARFSTVVSDRAAATAVPVIGGMGGAAINLIFMRHFQAVAAAHFTVRRLERAYGPLAVRGRYALISRTARS